MTWYSSWTPPKGLKSYLYLSMLMWAQSKLSAALKLASPVDSSSVIPPGCIRMVESRRYVVGEGEERRLDGPSWVRFGRGWELTGSCI